MPDEKQKKRISPVARRSDERGADTKTASSEIVISPDTDFSAINPYVRFVMRYYNTWEQHSVPRRSLYDYGLVVVLKGEIDFSYEGKTVEVHEGEAHIMPPAVNHFEYIKKGNICQYFVVHFDIVYRPETSDWRVDDVYLPSCIMGDGEMIMDEERLKVIRKEDAFITRPVKIKVHDFASLVEKLEKMEYVYDLFKPTADAQWDRLLLKAYLEEILVDLFEPERQMRKGYQAASVGNFIAYVNENLNKEIDVAAIAKSYGFTPNYFRTLFKRATRMSPYDYIQRKRIDKSKVKLDLTSDSVQDIAFQVGFDDPYYFSKVFKKTVGMTPSEYRKKDG